MLKKIIALCLLLIACQKSDQNFLPEAKLGQFVYDYTNTLTKIEIDSLNKLISDFEQETGNELALVILNEKQYQHYGYIEYAKEQIFKKFGIGKKEKDNGLLILDVPSQSDIDTEIGYGLESILNDAKIMSLVDQYAISDLRKGRNYQAYRSLLFAIIKILRN